MIFRKIFLLPFIVLFFTLPAQANDKPVPIELDHFIGYWQAPDNEKNNMAIVRPEKGWLGKAKEGDVEVHSNKRAWKGWIEDEVLKLSYLPRADEMNSEIPESVRKDLDGVLEWTMEVSLPDGAYGDELKAVWRRGHVEWKQKTGGEVTSYEITGEGKPIEFTLKRKPMLTVQMGGGITLDVRLAADIGMDRPEGAILQNLIQFQQIFAFVRMPEHEADKVGKTLDVNIKGLTSGATQSIRLYRTPSLPGKRVIYTHKDAFSLGECGIREARYDAGLLDPVELVGYVSSLFFSAYQEGSSLSEAMDQDMKTGSGHCKDFSGEHLEHVEFSYKDAAFRLQYFDNWIGYTLARQESALENAHRVLLDLSKNAPDVKSRQVAAEKIRMIDNYWYIVDHVELTPLHKVAIGEIYLGGGGAPAKYIQPLGAQYNCPTGDLYGLLNMDPAKIPQFADSHCLERPYEPDINMGEMFKFFFLDPKAGEHAHDRYLKVMPDVQWTSPAEQNLVNYAIKYSGTKAMNDAAKQFTKTGILTLYQVTTNVSVGISAADMYLLLTGYDIMGKKRPTAERIYAGLTIFNDSVDMSKTLHEAFHPHMFFSEQVTKKNKDDKAGWMSGWFNNKTKTRSSTHLNDIADSITKQAVRQQSGKAKTIERFIAATSTTGDIKISEKLDTKTMKLPTSLSKGQRKQLSLQLGSDLPKPDDPTVRLKTYPDLKMNTSGKLPKAEKVAAVNTATIKQSYGAKAKIIQDKRTQKRAPLANANRQAQSNASHILSTQSGKDYEQIDSPASMTAILDSAAAKGDVSLQGRKHAGFTQPYNDNTMQEFYRAKGYDMAVSDPKMNKRVNAKYVASAVKSGSWVETVMDLPGEDGTPTLRNIVIEDVLLDADGTPTKIAAFDPVMQTLVEMDAQDFNKTLARDIKQGNMRMITPNDIIKTQAIAPDRYVFPANTKTVKLDADSAPTIKIDPAAQKTIQLSKTENVKHFSKQYDIDKTTKINDATFRSSQTVRDLNQTALIDNSTFRQNQTVRDLNQTIQIDNASFRQEKTGVIPAEKIADAKAKIAEKQQAFQNAKTGVMDSEVVADAKAAAKEEFQNKGTQLLPADDDIVQQQKDLYQQDFQNRGTEKIDAYDFAAAKADADLDKNFGINPDPNASLSAQERFQNRGTEKIPEDIVVQEKEKLKQALQNRGTEQINAQTVFNAKSSGSDFGMNPDPDASDKTHRFTPDAEDITKTVAGDINDQTGTQKLNVNQQDQTSKQKMAAEDNSKTLPPSNITQGQLANAMQNHKTTTPEAGKSFTFVSDEGQEVSVPLGEVIGEGVAAKVYNHGSDANLVIKISAESMSNDIGSKIDNLGRLPFEQKGNKIDQKYLRIPTRGTLYTTGDGKTVQIIQKAEGELASKLLDKQNKIMTKGQAYAFERASRMINEEGFVWLDNHKNNFHLVKIGDGDEWKIEIVDTGGIIPAKGNSRGERAKNARTVQRAVNNPTTKAISATTGKQGIMVFNNRMGHVLHGDNDGVKGLDLLDFDAIQTGYDADDLQFHPEIAYNQPAVRTFARMGDAEFKAAVVQVSANAKSGAVDIGDLPASNTVRYNWALPHVLVYSNKATRNQKAIRMGSE